MKTEVIESMQGIIAKTPEFDRTQFILDEEPWDLSVDAGDDLVSPPPVMMYVGHGFWALGETMVTTAFGLPDQATPLPLLCSNSPAIFSVVNRGTPDIGDMVMLVSARDTAEFSMVGSVGDFVSTAGNGQRWHSISDEMNKDWYAKEFPVSYLFHTTSLAIEMAVSHGELDPMLSANEADVNQFVPTWRDKRECMVVDKTMGRLAVWHDEVRCQVCNGRVLLKLPRGNTLDSCTCPHSLRRPDIPNHELQFPHLVDNRTFEEGGDSLENVPKEAQ